jgi:DNA-binding response OmpR family regulator
MGTVLIIDDDADLRRLFAITLGRAGFATVTAPDGLLGLDLARAGAPSVVVMDLEMPGMNGWEVLEQLRADPDTAAVPVVLVTGRPIPEDQVRGARLHAYLQKPVALGRLLAAVQSALPAAG